MRVAVVGAGWAGMAAAVELARAGVPVTVFEASRVLGGRARSLHAGGLPLDNGQHILIGAYTETLRLLRLVGVDTGTALARLPLTLSYPGEFELRAPRLPAPLHLAAALALARGLTLADKLSALRFMRRLAARGFRLPCDCTVERLLDRHAQSVPLRRFLWEPLCVSALNTPAADASAQVFANVLRDSLGAGRAASDLLLPRLGLSELFPEPAARYVAAHGGEVLRARPVAGIAARAGGYALAGDARLFDRVVLAVAPYHLPRLLGGLPALAGVAADVARFAHQPIVTCYLKYAQALRLPAAMVGRLDGVSQWFFDRSALGGPAGLVAAVTSARGPHESLSHEELAQRVHEELGRLLGALPAREFGRVIVERRATFSCTPALARPAAQTPLPGLLLAGDYVASDYPGTLEAALRSGAHCARLIVASREARDAPAYTAPL